MLLVQLVRSQFKGVLLPNIIYNIEGHKRTHKRGCKKIIMGAGYEIKLLMKYKKLLESMEQNRKLDTTT